MEGIPPYPDVPGLGNWRREVRYAVVTASAQPDKAKAWLKEAERWTGNVLNLPKVSEFDTLGMKFGKALRVIVKGENRRELAVLQERLDRERNELLDGRQIYAWINNKFARDAKMARSYVLQEIANCRIGVGKNALSVFMNQWGAAMERLQQAGEQPGDEDILYAHVRTLQSKWPKSEGRQDMRNMTAMHGCMRLPRNVLRQ